MQQVAQRLDTTRQDYPEGGRCSAEALTKVYTWIPEALHETSSQPSDERANYATHREASLRMHRRGEAVVLSGFNPARHVSMICGRPVVVPL